MTNQIVTINVSQNVGATPSTLQRTGALISMGGTTKTASSLTLVTGMPDVTAILAPASSATDELSDMATTFFSQGSSIGVYILELGTGTPAAAIGLLTTWLNNNPQHVYAFLVPRSWDNDPAFLTLIAQYESTTAMTYFWVTTTQANYTHYLPTMKDVVAWLEAPSGLFATEFSAAAGFWITLHYKPSSTNKVTPFCFSYVSGVTPYPVVGTAPLRSQLKDHGVNIISTGSEGGITNDMLIWGSNMDVRPFNYWYSVDWCQINLKLQLANCIINGSNNPINPLYLNQDGINRLEAVAAKVMNSAVTFGLALGTVIQLELDGPDLADYFDSGAGAGQIVINAVPFVAYYTANPGDYKIGVYDGLSVTYTPLRGFDNITVNLNVSDFVTA
jgi:hypothetical protein